MSAAIAVLLVAAAFGELFGTLTVWLTYRRGVRVAEEFRAEVRGEEQELEAMGEGKRTMLAFDDVGTTFRVTALEGRFREARRRVTDQLEPSAMTTVGHWAFVVGALSGLAAGFLALYR
jgi:hypothetical protein